MASTTDIMNILTSFEERIMERLSKNQNQLKKAFATIDEKFESLSTSTTSNSKKSKASKEDKPKREQSDGQKQWNDFVSSVWEEIKLENPKATRQEAMKEASRRKDANDPEGAEKRAAAREKREATKASKKSSGKSSAADSGEEEEEEEEPVPKKKAVAKKAPVKKE